MSKFTDAVRNTLIGYFNAGDQPTEAQFTALITKIQEGIEEHQHDGTGDGDGALLGYTHAKAETNAGQALPDGASTLIIYEDELYDTGAEYNPATGVFTAGRTGYLQVTASMMMGSTTDWGATESARLEVYLNGVACAYLERDTDFTAANIYVSLAGSATLAITVGDTVDIRVYQNSGNARAVIADAKYNYVCFDWLAE